MSGMRNAMLAVGGLIAVGAAGAAGTHAAGLWGNDPAACSGTVVTAPLGGPFTLTAHTGETVSRDDLKGTPTLLYFGYSTCPDICPMELTDMAEAADALAERGVDVRTAFVTVDPARDDQARMAEYVGFFHDEMIGLTGEKAATDTAAKAYKVWHRQVDDPDLPGGYAVDHTGYVYLLDEEARTTAVFAKGSGVEALTEGVACRFG